MPKIDQGAVEALLVPLAPHAEQDRIVAAIEQHLSDVDAGVAALERVLANLKRYRASVLKAACEGRLVPTEAKLAHKEGRDYEPADVLLRRILKERRERWEADQLAKMKAKGQAPRDDRWKAKYEEPKGPDTSELPALPVGWVWSTVETVGDVLLGRQRAPQYLTGQWTRPYLRVANVKDDILDFSDIETMDFDPAHFGKYRLEPGDILVSEGQSPDRVGESAIYSGGIEGLCFQKTLHRFRPVPLGPGPKFAQIVFRAYVKSGVFRKMASITTNIAHLTLEKFQAAPFPLPPVDEQRRITAEVDRFLSVADEIEQTVQAQLARAQRLRQSVLKRAFEGKLVPQDATEFEATTPEPPPTLGSALRISLHRQKLPVGDFAQKFRLARTIAEQIEACTAPYRPSDIPTMTADLVREVPGLGYPLARRIVNEIVATTQAPAPEGSVPTRSAAREAPRS